MFPRAVQVCYDPSTVSLKKLASAESSVTRGQNYDFKIFSPKNSAKKLAFLTQKKTKLYKILIITLFF
jgi:hypothetical protein